MRRAPEHSKTSTDSVGEPVVGQFPEQNHNHNTTHTHSISTSRYSIHWLRRIKPNHFARINFVRQLPFTIPYKVVPTNGANSDWFCCRCSYSGRLIVSIFHIQNYALHQSCDCDILNISMSRLGSPTIIVES